MFAYHFTADELLPEIVTYQSVAASLHYNELNQNNEAQSTQLLVT